MPLDAKKVHGIILAHAEHHDEDQCEFCTLIDEMKQNTHMMNCLSVTAAILAIESDSLSDLFFQAFTAGLVVGVKLERSERMEEAFKL